MIYKKEELNVNDTRCIAYSCENPKYILIQPVDEHDIKVLDREVELILMMWERIFAYCF